MKAWKSCTSVPDVHKNLLTEHRVQNKQGTKSIKNRIPLLRRYSTTVCTCLMIASLTTAKGFGH